MARPEVVGIPNGIFAENCWLVADPATREAIIIDPGEEANLFLARLSSEGWSPSAIWLTHAHVDHVAGVAAVKQATGVPVYLHPADRSLYDNADRHAALYGLSVEPPPPPDFELKHGDRMTVGSCTFDVLHVPGHSPGHVAFTGYGLCLSGDVLFAGSVGRTDLPGADPKALVASIMERLYALPDTTRVLPGHGPETTIGEEKQSNPFVRLTKGVNACLRCGAPVKKKPWGCKNPCPNCGHVYPLGDCSD